MRRLTAVLQSMNLYAEISVETAAKWHCHCFGRTLPDSKVWSVSEETEAGNSHVTVTFNDREKVISGAGKPTWQTENPHGAIWVDFSRNPSQPHHIQATINLSSDVYRRVETTNLSRDSIIVALGYDNLTARGEYSANAFLSSVIVHFQTRSTPDGLFGRRLA